MSISVSKAFAFLVAPALCLSSAATVISAEPSWSEPESLLGSRVRITTKKDPARARRIEGRVERFDDGQLVLAFTDGTPSKIVPLASVRRLEIHHGRKRATKRGLLSGVVAGGLAGAVVGVAWGSYSTLDRDMSADATASMAAGLVVGGAAGGLLGGAAGAGIGTLFAEDDWREAPRKSSRTGLSLEPTRGGVRAAFSVSF